MEYCPMIMIFSAYSLARKIFMEKPYQVEWVPTSMCENPIRSSPKESVPDIRNFIFVWGVIVVMWSSTHTVFTGVSYYDHGYYSSLVMISDHTCTG